MEWTVARLSMTSPSELPDDLQPRAPRIALDRGIVWPVVRAGLLWPLIPALCAVMLHGWVLVLAEALGQSFHALVALELAWPDRLRASVEWIALAAPILAWFVHASGGRRWLRFPIEKHLVGVIAWGTLVYPVAVLLDTLGEAIA